MKSAGNRGVVQSRLQMLHVHVFLVAPLGACHMAQPCADQHQGGVAVRERPYHPRSSADLTVQPLDYIVGADTCPMLAWKAAVGQLLSMSLWTRFGIVRAIRYFLGNISSISIFSNVQKTFGLRVIMNTVNTKEIIVTAPRNHGEVA